MSAFGALTGVVLFLFFSYLLVRLTVIIFRRFEDRKNEKFEKRSN